MQVISPFFGSVDTRLPVAKYAGLLEDHLPSGSKITSAGTEGSIVSALKRRSFHLLIILLESAALSLRHAPSASHRALRQNFSAAPDRRLCF